MLLFALSLLVLTPVSVAGAAGKIRILIVPGHDNEFSGTSYRGLREADITLEAAEYLFDYLSRSRSVETILVRDRRGYRPEFSAFFVNERPAIRQFITEKEGGMQSLIKEGKVARVRGVPHNEAPEPIETRLFGINMWASENDIDLVVHLHINDYPRVKTVSPGVHTGFTIYVPERQYVNAATSTAVAQSILRNLSVFYPVSTLPGEDRGVVEDQWLIAVGASNSLSSPALLIEYGYIYEPQFQERRARSLYLRDFSYQIFRGIKQFYAPREINLGRSESALIPHRWQSDLRRSKSVSPEVLALQVALSRIHMYPPRLSSRTDCPITGLFGPCTERAVRDFQWREGLPTTGVVGQRTRALLNSIFEKE